MQTTDARFLGMLLVLALAGLGCSDDAASTDAGVAVDAKASDAGKKQDSKTGDASADSGMATPDSGTAKPDAATACAAKPSGFCKGSEPACSWSGEICRCLSVCGGRKPPPGKEYSWSCAPPPPAGCPAIAPKTGESCSQSGLKCNYGHCPVTRAECISGKWSVKSDPLPP